MTPKQKAQELVEEYRNVARMTIAGCGSIWEPIARIVLNTEEINN